MAAGGVRAQLPLWCSVAQPAEPYAKPSRSASTACWVLLDTAPPAVVDAPRLDEMRTMRLVRPG